MHVGQLDSRQLLRLMNWFKEKNQDMVEELSKTAGQLTAEMDHVALGMEESFGHPDLVVVYVDKKPPCDFDKTHGEADYDGQTVLGPWAYMCLACFNKLGTGLGTGRGQKLELRK